MTPPYHVEILSRTLEVKNRHRVGSLPIRIGRGYDNDIILDDPHVAVHHAVIAQNDTGELLLRGLDTQNGIIYKKVRLREMTINGDQIFSLGHTNLRVRGVDYPVGEEISDTLAYRWEGWKPALTGLALLAIITLLATWASDIQEYEMLRYLGYLALTLGAGVIWCGIWAFANRLFGSGARFGRHLFILGCGFAALELIDFGGNAAAYAFSWETLTRYGAHGLIAIVSVMVFFHLRSISPERAGRVALISVCLAALASGLLLMNNYYRYGRPAGELYMHNLFPPAIRLSADLPVSRLLEDVEKLKPLLDKKRVLPVNGDDDPADASDW